MINPSIYPPPQRNTTQSITPLPPELLMRTLSRLCPTKTHTHTHTNTSPLTSFLLFTIPLFTQTTFLPPSLPLSLSPSLSPPPPPPSLSPSLSIHHSTQHPPTYPPTYPLTQPQSQSQSQPPKPRKTPTYPQHRNFMPNLSREREREKEREVGRGLGNAESKRRATCTIGTGFVVFTMCVLFLTRLVFCSVTSLRDTHTHVGKFARVLKKPCRRRCTL